MGKIVANIKRRVVVEFDGRTQTGLEMFSALSDGKVVRTKPGAETGSKVDGSKLATVFVQLQPGYVKRVVGYGEDADRILSLKEGDTISALLNPMPGGWFKLAEFVDVESSQPEPELPPAA